MEFVLTLDGAKFSSTNAAWNDLMLNDPWSVGYVTTLIALQPFAQKEDWEAFYYASGTERENQILQLNEETQAIVQNESLVRTNKGAVTQLSWDLKNLNTQYGRTRERLQRKAEILFEAVRRNGRNLSVEDCFECVRFRVICETWNGVIIRERNTIAKLQSMYPNIEFRKVTGEMDYTYAVDYEVVKDGRLVSAIQIKPESYTRNLPYVNKARNANRIKNALYYEKYGVRVFDIIADNKGNVVNPEALKNL